MHATRDNSQRLQPRKGAKELNAQLNGNLQRNMWPRCVVSEKSNGIIGVVTIGFKCLPPSCDGLTGSEDHDQLFPRLIHRAGFRSVCSDLVVVILAQKVKDACIEDERKYRAPLLPAGLLLAAMNRVGSSHAS
ncbi:hypothetical protein F511_14781 [Dorcoceras hygrometricum]|uniref:Uncharacterized protein n=1 Tax=Dorcoceras hygrometricum TaxID=472368 RepID=A0A2Z7C4A6_9LAMI|nr:hypothetical protein F511_14781 [Dorcoceras hygrometricum]